MGISVHKKIVQKILKENGFTPPKVMIVDNDGIYGKWLKQIFKEYFDVKVIKIPSGMPWCNGICERFHRTLRNELLNRTVLNNLAHIQSIINEFKNYCNCFRPHQGIEGKIPLVENNVIPFPSKNINLKYEKKYHLNGLITSFQLAG